MLPYMLTCRKHGGEEMLTNNDVVSEQQTEISSSQSFSLYKRFLGIFPLYEIRVFNAWHFLAEVSETVPNFPNCKGFWKSLVLLGEHK